MVVYLVWKATSRSETQAVPRFHFHTVNILFSIVWRLAMDYCGSNPILYFERRKQNWEENSRFRRPLLFLAVYSAPMPICRSHHKMLKSKPNFIYIKISKAARLIFNNLIMLWERFRTGWCRVLALQLLARPTNEVFFLMEVT